MRVRIPAVVRTLLFVSTNKRIGRHHIKYPQNEPLLIKVDLTSYRLKQEQDNMGGFQAIHNLGRQERRPAEAEEEKDDQSHIQVQEGARAHVRVLCG